MLAVRSIRRTLHIPQAMDVLWYPSLFLPPRLSAADMLAFPPAKPRTFGVDTERRRPAETELFLRRRRTDIGIAV